MARAASADDAPLENAVASGTEGSGERSAGVEQADTTATARTTSAGRLEPGAAARLPRSGSVIGNFI